MNKIVFQIISILLIVTNSAFAQDIKKIVKQADQFFNQKNYRTALQYYQDAQALNPHDAYINYRIGFCLLNTNSYKKALPYLQKAYQKNSKVDEFLTYLIGQAHQLNFEFAEARISYELFHKYHSTPSENEMVRKRLKECEYGELLVAHPVKAKIQNLGPEINSKYSDYAPVIKADESEIVFTSTREGTTNNLKDTEGEYFEDVYTSKVNNGKWSAPQNLGSPINTEANDASIGLSPDGNLLFIYRDSNKGDIFLSKRSGTRWEEPSPFKEINSKYAESHCSITADGRTLYFASNRPDGFGGFDIYKTTKDASGKWSNPVNLGPTINTKEDEDAPFIHANGTTLYFSSKGHTTMGGYDVFKVEWENGTWKVVENVGYPINSPDDDLYFVLSADGKTGYYSSTKEDTYGERDIYKILMSEMAIPTTEHNTNVTTPVSKPAPDLNISNKSVGRPITIIKGTVKDASTKNSINALVHIIDNLKDEEVLQLQSNASTGSFLAILQSGRNYAIRVEKEGYIFSSENLDLTKSNSYQELNKEIELKKIMVGTKFELNNVFFDNEKSTLRPESFPELNRLLEMLQSTKYNIRIDGVGEGGLNSKNNASLSEKRVKEVVDYLISKGIDSKRIKYGVSKQPAIVDKKKRTDTLDKKVNSPMIIEIIGSI